MQNIIEDRKCLASWAVFKRLCDEGHKNIYDVLRDFIKATIYRNGLRSFNEATLTVQVNKDYEFNLKAAVVAYALKDLSLKKDSKTGLFECDPTSFADESGLDQKIEESTAINNVILEGLFDLVERNFGKTLVSSEKESIIKSFIHYLLNNSYEDEYSALISAYLLQCKKNERLSSAIDNILEGVIRYVGVNFDSPGKASSRWSNEMTIYLDTEILFHMAGFNGSLYKRLFDDFYELVEEINQDSKDRYQRNLIKLKYFDYVSEEIEQFFEIAKDIIKGNLILNPSVTAMKEITSGCKTESEIAEKKGLFLALIDAHGIEQDDNDIAYYQESNHTFNLEDNTIINKFCAEYSYNSKKDVQDSLISLSHINVLRQGKSNRSFEKLGYVLLTDNFITEKLAWMSEIKRDDEKPLCTTLFFITNRMWYKLGKSFGNNLTPKIFDVISKAQIILSNKIKESVYSQYELLVNQLEKKEISSQEAKEVLYQLRSQVKNPEEIDESSEIDKVMMPVGEPEIRKYIEEAEYRKTKYKQAEEENQRLNELNEQITAHSEDVEKQLEKVSQENEDVRRENEAMRQESEIIKNDSAQKEALLKHKTEETIQLEKNLEIAKHELYDYKLMVYNDQKNDYKKGRVRKAKWSFALFIIFLICTIVLAFIILLNEETGILPKWLKVTLSIFLSQIIPIIRIKVTKISFSTVWKVVIKKDSSSFEKEFEQNNPEPTLDDIS